MKRPWHKTNPVLLEEIESTLDAYADLRLVEENQTILVRGTFPVLDDRGEVLDRYQVEVRFPGDYPVSLPHVYETAGRVPRTVDRHTYTPSGRCCVVVDEDWLVKVGEPSFRAFLDGPVRNYFIGQTLVEAVHPWPFGERSHAVKGLVETYGEWFDTEDKATVLRHLECIRHEQIKGHWLCPCGSGEKLRKCHLEKVRDVQKRVSPRLAERAFRRLLFAIKSESAALRFAEQQKRVFRTDE